MKVGHHWKRRASRLSMLGGLITTSRNGRKENSHQTRSHNLTPKQVKALAPPDLTFRPRFPRRRI